VSDRRADGTEVLHVHLRLPVALVEVLDRHASLRKMATSRFTEDALIVHMTMITDPDDIRFKPEVLGVQFPPLPQERFEGYLRSLGWEEQ